MAAAADRMVVLGALTRASNATLLVRLGEAEDAPLAVYKPRAGERPLWDFPDGTLCAREVAASVVARELDRKSTRLNSSHVSESRMPSSA